MNGELAEGMSDGTVKKTTRDRGGFVEETTPRIRRELNDKYLNIESDSYATGPDGMQRYRRGTVPVFPHVEY
jgi:hypothetical protein